MKQKIKLPVNQSRDIFEIIIHLLININMLYKNVLRIQFHKW